MRYQLQNKYIQILVDSNGAELRRLFHVQHHIDYLWAADPTYWGKSSPILFPIVGTLNNNNYIIEEKKYSLPRHGFARDMEFEASYVSESEICFRLVHNDATLSKFPFEFILEIKYTVVENILHVDYKVQNPSPSKSMWFSIGGHPAFNVPLHDEDEFQNWYLHFPDDSQLERIYLNKGILSDYKETIFLAEDNKLFLNEYLFQKDAIVLNAMKSNFVYLQSVKTNHGLRMDFEGFPWFGIWKVPHAPFVCLEPWCGVSDFWNSTGDLSEKEGINLLTGAQTWHRRWSITLF